MKFLSGGMLSGSRCSAGAPDAQLFAAPAIVTARGMLVLAHTAYAAYQLLAAPCDGACVVEEQWEASISTGSNT